MQAPVGATKLPGRIYETCITRPYMDRDIKAVGRVQFSVRRTWLYDRHDPNMRRFERQLNDEQEALQSKIEAIPECSEKAVYEQVRRVEEGFVLQHAAMMNDLSWSRRYWNTFASDKQSRLSDPADQCDREARAKLEDNIRFAARQRFKLQLFQMEFPRSQDLKKDESAKDYAEQKLKDSLADLPKGCTKGDVIAQVQTREHELADEHAKHVGDPAWAQKYKSFRTGHKRSKSFWTIHKRSKS